MEAMLWRPFVMGDLVTSEMEAMVLFHKHKHTTWWGWWMLGDRQVADSLLNDMQERGLVVIRDLGGEDHHVGGEQYVLAKKFRRRPLAKQS
jgi:hypothetical protein